MYTTRLMTLIALSVFAQGVLANTIWLKDRQGNVCYNNQSQNPGGVIGYGGINRNGTGFTMTIDNPQAGTVTPSSGDCTTIPKANQPLVFGAGNVVANVVPITNVKTGTNNAPECLDQGLNLSGITGGSTVGTGGNARSIAFSFTGAAGCPHPNYSVPTYQAPFQRTVSIRTGSGPAQRIVYQGAYHIYNTASVPEPGSLLLLLAGATGFGVLALSRRKAGRRQL